MQLIVWHPYSECFPFVQSVLKKWQIDDYLPSIAKPNHFQWGKKNLNKLHLDILIVCLCVCIYKEKEVI